MVSHGGWLQNPLQCFAFADTFAQNAKHPARTRKHQPACDCASPSESECRNPRKQLWKGSLQLRVLRLGLLQDGDVGVGVLPERERIVVRGAHFDGAGRERK